MKKKTITQVLMARIPTLVVCGLMALGAPAVSQPNEPSDTNNGRCSNRILFGNYGSSSQGLLLPAPGVALEFRGLTMTHFDGRGNLTWVEHTVVQGTPVQPGWVAASGTYTVNPDCTGTAVVNTPNSPVPLNLALVVVKRGKEVRTVLDAHAILSVFIKVE